MWTSKPVVNVQMNIRMFRWGRTHSGHSLLIHSFTSIKRRNRSKKIARVNRPYEWNPPTINPVQWPENMRSMIKSNLTFKFPLSPNTYKAAGSQPCVIIALSTVETRFMSLSFARRSIVADDMLALDARDFCFAVALLLDTGVAETKCSEKNCQLWRKK